VQAVHVVEKGVNFWLVLAGPHGCVASIQCGLLVSDTGRHGGHNLSQFCGVRASQSIAIHNSLVDA